MPGGDSILSARTEAVVDGVGGIGVLATCDANGHVEVSLDGTLLVSSSEDILDNLYNLRIARNSVLIKLPALLRELEVTITADADYAPEDDSGNWRRKRGHAGRKSCAELVEMIYGVYGHRHD